MKGFIISIIPATAGNFTVYISNTEINCNHWEFCGSMFEVGDYIRTIVTQQ